MSFPMIPIDNSGYAGRTVIFNESVNGFMQIDSIVEAILVFVGSRIRAIITGSSAMKYDSLQKPHVQNLIQPKDLDISGIIKQRLGFARKGK